MDGQEFMRHAAKEMEALVAGDILTIIEFAPDAVLVWEVVIDPSGTPRKNALRAPWEQLRDVAGELSADSLLKFSRPSDRSRLILARTGQDSGPANEAFQLLTATHRRASAYSLGQGESVDGALDEAAARVPLRQRYDLVVLRRIGVDGLRQDVEKLFAAGAARGGHPRRLPIRIEAAGQSGTTFAVLASDEDDDPPQYRLVSVRSGVVPSRAYTLTATLMRPGEVHFDFGEQVWLEPDDRSWPEILATVPERLERLGPAHVIIAVEACGPEREFKDRVEVAQRLVEAVENETAERVAYSLIGYAGHAHYLYGLERDRDPDMLAWGDSGEAALSVLERMGEHGAAPVSPAAQLECVLARLLDELSGADAVLGRPVLVTIGSRVPYPAQRDPAAPTRMLPCPWHHDWRRIFRRLGERHRGIAFGAIHDEDPKQEIWRALGTHARASVSDIDVRPFAAGLGLVRSGVQAVPFPLINVGGTNRGNP